MSTSEQTDPTLAFAIDLIERESVTPADGGCQQAIAARLEAVGFSTEHVRFGEVDNLWATHGSGSPLLCFAGHTDVVPPGPAEDWDTDPFKAEIVGDELRGRGAADMKTALAAMTEAALAWRAGDLEQAQSFARLAVRLVPGSLVALLCRALLICCAGSASPSEVTAIAQKAIDEAPPAVCIQVLGLLASACPDVPQTWLSHASDLAVDIPHHDMRREILSISESLQRLRS